MSRSARRGDRTTRIDHDTEFQHSSRHADLESLLADHMLGPAGADATAEWFPSRRGNSPRTSDLESPQTPSA